MLFDQFTEFSKLIGVGRNWATGEIKGIGVTVVFLKFCQVKSSKRLGKLHRLLNGPMQKRNRNRKLSMLLLSVIKPLLAMGTAMPALINSDTAFDGQIIKQRCRCIPGQSHQTTHALGGSSLKKLSDLRLTQQLIEVVRHLLTQTFCNQWTEPCWGQLERVNGIEGTLTCRIEFTKFVEFIPKKLQSYREFTTHGIDVNNVATSAPGSLLINRRDALVTKLAEVGRQLLKVDNIAFL